MARAIRRLSAVAIRNAKPGLHPDGGNLYLQVSESGAKSWLFRYGAGGRERWMGLGSLITVSLAEAREEALQCRSLRLKGVDPIEARRAARGQQTLDAAKAITFRKCAESYQAAHGTGWRSKRHAAQWDQSMADYVFPVFGDLPVAAIDIGLVMKALEPIWAEKPETASRVRGRIETGARLGEGARLPRGENPARWRGHLDKLLPRAKQGRARSRTMPALALPRGAGVHDRSCAQQEGIAARALEFTILTAAAPARCSALAGLRSTGERLDDPGRAHEGRARSTACRCRIGRSGSSSALPRDGDLVFAVRTRRRRSATWRPCCGLLRRMGRDDLTVHGFRSTFRDWAAEHDELSEPSGRDGAGARRRRQGRGRLPARRPVREAPPADGGLGRDSVAPGRPGAAKSYRSARR